MSDFSKNTAEIARFGGHNDLSTQANCVENYTNINGHIVHSMQFGCGKDVVFMHGWGGDISAFLFVAKAISTHFRVLIFDFAGFGDSEIPDENYTVKRYADDVVRLLDLHNVKSATFVGHSFGGRVGIEIAANHANLVEKLVLIDSAGLKPRRKLSYYIKVFVHKLLKKLGGNGLNGSADYCALPKSMRKIFVNVVNYHQDKQLKYIKCPTAIFFGKEDKDTPLYMYRRFLKGIEGSQGFLLEGGHYSYVDDYVKFMLIFKAFLEE